MEALFKILSRPINVRTVMDGKHTMIRFDGNEHTSETVSATDGLGENEKEEEDESS